MLYRFALNNRRDNFKYCQLVDNGDVITATKTEGFSLKLKTKEMTESALSFINTACRSIIISSKNDKFCCNWQKVYT